MANIVAGLSFGIITLSIAYEWAYFSVVGRHYQMLLDPIDYFNAATAWLPQALLGIVVGLLVHSALLRVENFKSEREIRETFKTDKSYWMTRRLSDIITSIALILLSLGSFLVGNPYHLHSAIFVIIISWIWFFSWFYRHEKVQNYFAGNSLALVCLFSPICIFLAAVGGYAQGYDDLITNTKTINIRSAKGGIDSYILLRAFKSGLLVRPPKDEKLVFLKWDQIGSYSADFAAPDSRSRICKSIGYFCN